MNGRTPTKAEKQWMQAIVDYGCVVCRNEGKHTPPSVHHINGSKKEGCHFETLPLCWYHHQEGVNTPAYVSRHPWKSEFEKRYGTEEKLLDQLKKEIILL